MKKLISVVLACCLLFLLTGLTGCGDKASKGQGATQTRKIDRERD